MKCPNCEQIMKTVEVEFLSPSEVFALDEDTGKYEYEDDIEDDGGDYILVCGECGCELPDEVASEFQEMLAM